MSGYVMFKLAGKLARNTTRLFWSLRKGQVIVAIRHPNGNKKVWLALVIALGICSQAAAAGFGGLFSDQPIVQATKKESVSDAQAALIDGASANATADDGTPVLVIAVKLENVDLVRLLVENGARPDIKARDETTALTLAAANGNLDIVTLLLEHGADVNEPGSLRETAIIKAARGRRNAVIRVLVAKGADLDETDATGATAMDIAKSAGWNDTAELLKKAGPK